MSSRPMYTVQTKPGARARGRRGHTAPTRSRLRDDPPLAHALREKHLAERVVDLVGAGVEQVLALHPDLRATARLAETRRMGHRGGPSGVVVEQEAQLALERPVGEGLVHGCLELGERGNHGLGDVRSAVHAETASGHAHRGAEGSPGAASAARAAAT